MVNIFKVHEDTENESGESQLKPISDSPNSDLQIDIGDWVLVHYQGSNFPGEVTAIYGLDFKVNVMHKSGNVFWKWPLKENKIVYEPPEVAGTRGLFTFKDL